MGGFRTKGGRFEPRKRPVQERSRALVDAVLTAAAQVFEADGYDGATTDGIAERAGVSVGSLYQYFPSKDALLVGLFERHLDDVEGAFDELRSAMADAEALGPLMRRMVGRLFGLHREFPKVHQLFVTDAPVPARLLERYVGLQRRFVSDLAAWLAPIVGAPAEVASFIMSVVEPLAHRYTAFPLPDRHSADSVENEAAEMLIAYVERAAG